MEKENNIAIVGAGASGLFLAKQLSLQGHFNVYVFEKNTKIGTKIKASGGGKANIFNSKIEPNCYNDSVFISNLLKTVDNQVIKKVFNELGLRLFVDEENRVYPATFSSQSVLDVLLLNLSNKVQIISNYEVKTIKKENNLYKINDFSILFHQVVFASGSPAGMIAKNRENYNSYLSDFHLNIHSLSPSLVGFKIKAYPKILFGCRAKAKVSLIQNKKLIFSEFGEVMFKEDGISGIVILNASAYYNRLKNKQNCLFSLDFLYDEHYNLEQHWQKYHDFCGILPPKLNQLYKHKSFNIRDFQLTIDKTYDFDFAQVSSGGIDVQEINENFQLKSDKNIYIIGEMLNIDAVCGGYNLFFAFASAYKVAQHLIYGNKN